MLLIIGGEASGKRSYAKSLGFTVDMMADAVIDDRPCIFHLERLVMASPGTSDELLPRLLEKEVIICCEVGSGVIPVGKMLREGREAVGRLCIKLAANADCVVRMVSGIPVVIKGKLP
ncbi:MAG: bifunctional adenosylcobinamide kinase/adenosylcobinamide-phosphate guanylyltransferase [Oscillospiraceae bacterium]|nr:bifunctional adenosylcobinamide kinase/adenosylcobinamide-phosphate guanylyltransferase [Oscillospiraceae bacterium]